MTVIIIPHTPPKTDTQQIFEASLEYSNDQELQEAYRDGADFWREVSAPPTRTFVIQVIAFIYVILQITAFVVGLTGIESRIESRWRYVFPTHNAGLSASQWMGERP